MKKLTYLVASLMIAVAAGTMFTGCINSDEPAGIANLRDAKAALLKSKQALIEAQAAKELAEAEAIKVEAAAKAALIEAQKARTEAETEEIKQRTADAMVQAQENINYLKQQLENLKLAYEREKLALSEQQQRYVEYYYNKYFNALDEYNIQYTAWLEAQKRLVASALDPNGDKFDGKERVEDAVAEAEKNLADANKEIAEFKDNLELAKTWKPTELGARLNQYQEELKANTEKKALIDLKIAENNEESEEAKLKRELEAKVNDLKNEAITVPAYTFNADGNITIPGVETEELFEEGRYSLNELDYNTYYNYYDVVCRALEGKKAWLSDYVLNENGQAWTQAKINELTRNKAENDKAYEADLATWQMFVKAYNQGAEPDYKALEGYDALNEAVTAYNKSLVQFETAKAELIKAEEAAVEARKALKDDAADEAWKNREEAYAAAKDEYNSASENAQNDYSNTIAGLNKAVKNAQLDLAEGEAKRVAAENLSKADPKDEALKKAAEEAVKAVGELKKALEAAEKNLKDQAPIAEAKMKKAEAVAKAAYDVAIAEAEKNYGLATIEVSKEDLALKEAYEAAYSKYNEADEAFGKESGNAIKLLEEVGNAVQKQGDTLGSWDYTALYIYYQKLLAATEYYPIAEDPNDAGRKAFEAKLPECTVAEVCAIQPDDLKQKVIAASYDLYGNAIITRLPEHNSIKAFLVPLTKDEVIDYITSNNINQDELWYNFGSYGTVLANENRIEVAQAYLSNKAAVDAAFAELDKKIEDLKATKDAQEEKVKKAEEELQKAEQALEDLNAELKEQSNELEAKIEFAGRMIGAIEDAAWSTGAAQEDNYTQESIDLVIENLENIIEELESGIPALEKDVERAKYMLDQYEKGQLYETDMAQFDVEKAKLALDLAKTKLDEAKAQLDAANKRLEAAA